MAGDDVSRIMEYIGYGIGRFYCSYNVSWKLAEALDWLHGAITEALTRPDTRIFYMLQAYHQLLSILAYCHEGLAHELRGKTPYEAYRSPEITSIIEKIRRG